MRSLVGLFIMLGAVFFAVAGIYVPPIWGKVLLFAGAVLLGLTDYFYQRSRTRMLEAEEELFKARESLKKEARRKKVDEQERLCWQLEKVKESLKEKQLDHENLRDAVAELRSTDSRLDSIDEELEAVTQAVLAIREITREIYRGICPETQCVCFWDHGRDRWKKFRRTLSGSGYGDLCPYRREKPAAFR
ncbi:MAG: hypothetical protein V8S22_05980 [Lachnospiraceae bacterium]